MLFCFCPHFTVGFYVLLCVLSPSFSSIYSLLVTRPTSPSSLPFHPRYFHFPFTCNLSPFSFNNLQWLRNLYYAKCLTFMSPVLCEILLSGFIINSSFRRRTHLVQSFSVVFLYWFYVFSLIPTFNSYIMM